MKEDLHYYEKIAQNIRDKKGCLSDAQMAAHVNGDWRYRWNVFQRYHLMSCKTCKEEFREIKACVEDAVPKISRVSSASALTYFPLSIKYAALPIVIVAMFSVYHLWSRSTYNEFTQRVKLSISDEIKSQISALELKNVELDKLASELKLSLSLERSKADAITAATQKRFTTAEEMLVNIQKSHLDTREQISILNSVTADLKSKNAEFVSLNDDIKKRVFEISAAWEKVTAQVADSSMLVNTIKHEQTELSASIERLKTKAVEIVDAKKDDKIEVFMIDPPSKAFVPVGAVTQLKELKEITPIDKNIKFQKTSSISK